MSENEIDTSELKNSAKFQNWTVILDNNLQLHDERTNRFTQFNIDVWLLLEYIAILKFKNVFVIDT